MIAVARLDEIVFHDVPVEALTITVSEKPELYFELMPHDDVLGCYRRTNVHITDVDTIEFDEYSVQASEEVEINYFDYETSRGVLKGKIWLFIGSPARQAIIRFTARTVEVKGWPFEELEPKMKS